MHLLLVSATSRGAIQTFSSPTNGLESLIKQKIDKNFLFRGGSVGGLFLLVKGYYGIEKQGGDAVGKGRWSGH